MLEIVRGRNIADEKHDKSMLVAFSKVLRDDVSFGFLRLGRRNETRTSSFLPEFMKAGARPSESVFNPTLSSYSPLLVILDSLGAEYSFEKLGSLFQRTGSPSPVGLVRRPNFA